VCKRLDSNAPEQFTILLHIQTAAAFLPNISSIRKDGAIFAGECVDGTVDKTVALESVKSVMASFGLLIPMVPTRGKRCVSFACQKSPGTHISTHVKLPPSSTGNFAMAASMQSWVCSGVPTNRLDDERTRCAIWSCYRRVLKLKLKGEQMLPKSINKRSPMHKHLSTTTFRDGNYFVGDDRLVRKSALKMRNFAISHLK
jgi:hypothetical protein